VHGDEILVEGVITDISPGTSEYALTARFPDGVPVVGDESMTDWMQYVYMQYPRPADVTGVGVSISVIDPNNNVYEVATATTGENGFYSTTFTPEVPGKYTVMAMFAGTKSYVGSYAQTAINVGAAPEPTVAPTQAPASMADLYFLPVSIVLIIAIVIVLVLMLLLFRKR
jgi:hypothetical protein